MNRGFAIQTLILAGTVFLAFAGCANKLAAPDEVSWRLVERRAEPTGTELYTVEIVASAPHADGSAVVVPGIVVRQIEVDRWNVYECQETRKGRIIDDVKRRVVTDPIGKPLEDADTELTAASIKDITREVTGLQLERADYLVAPAFAVTWSIPALRDAGSSTFAGTVTPDSWGKFEVRITGEALKAASRLPTGEIQVVVSIGVASTGKNSVQTSTCTIQRSVFVQAAENAQ